MHIANRRRFLAFCALVAALLTAAGLLVFFRVQPLMAVLSRSIDVEALSQIEMTAVGQENTRTTKTLNDPTAIRACLAALDGAQVRRQVAPDSIRGVVPGESFFLRITDRSGRETTLDIAGQSIVLNLNTGYSLISPASLRALLGAMGGETAASPVL